MMLSKKKHLAALSAAHNYKEWKELAQAYDEKSGGDEWKRKEESELYDYQTIRERLTRLNKLRREKDHRGLLFALNEGIHGNMGGMGKSALYEQAKFGTKKLIEDYVKAINNALIYLASDKVSDISFEEKLDFFRRANVCFGRSAIMFSSGGNLVYFHVGVAKALLEQQLLPNVISGSSAGAMIAAILGTHTEKELKKLFKPEKINFGSPWQPNFFEKTTGIRRIFDTSDIEGSFERLIPNLTFAEALERTGRHINISISPAERHQTSRLLNATTSPNVLIRSAVKASCAIPGIIGPVTLAAKNENGEIVPYLPSRGWLDGAIADDLPAKRLSRLYGVNHYIVSMINPYALRYIKTPEKIQRIGRPFQLAGKAALQQSLKGIDNMLSNYRLNKNLGNVVRLWHDLMDQKYLGDINITLDAKHASPFKLISPYTLEEVEHLIQEGERSTWPRIEQVKTSSKIGITLQDILSKLEKFEHEIIQEYDESHTGQRQRNGKKTAVPLRSVS